jgi:RHS repeat-associated protein
VDAGGVVREQYEYDPYGMVKVYSGAGSYLGGTSPLGLAFLWKAVRLDAETGLLYMRNRYYSTGLGRFLTRDPIGVWGDPLNCGNEYGYCGEMPLAWSDPYGLFGWAGALAGLVVGAAVGTVKGLMEGKDLWDAFVEDGIPNGVAGAVIVATVGLVAAAPGVVAAGASACEVVLTQVTLTAAVAPGVVTAKAMIRKTYVSGEGDIRASDLVFEICLRTCTAGFVGWCSVTVRDMALMPPAAGSLTGSSLGGR